MPTKGNHSTSQSGEFVKLMRKLIAVPKKELDEKIAEFRDRKRRPVTRKKPA